MKDVIDHGPRWEWDVYGRLSRASCLCDMCEGRRLWGAIVLLLAGAGAAIGIVAWACLS